MQVEQGHGGHTRHPGCVRRQPGHHCPGAGPESAVAGTPAQDQEAHRGQQEHHAVDVQAGGTTAAAEPTVRDYHRELLQHEHLRNGKASIVSSLCSWWGSRTLNGNPKPIFYVSPPFDYAKV